MFDSLTIARQLTKAGIDRGHADAVADAIRQAAEHGEHVTPERFDAGIADLRTEITALESRIYRAFGRCGSRVRSSRPVGEPAARA